MPAYYRDIPGLFQDYVKPEVLIAVVSPMDKHGYFSTGCDGSLSAALFATAKTVLLEVNPHMPRSLSSTQIHISQVDALWENDAPMMCLPPKEIDEVRRPGLAASLPRRFPTAPRCSWASAPFPTP